MMLGGVFAQAHVYLVLNRPMVSMNRVPNSPISRRCLAADRLAGCAAMPAHGVAANGAWNLVGHGYSGPCWPTVFGRYRASSTSMLRGALGAAGASGSGQQPARGIGRHRRAGWSRPRLVDDGLPARPSCLPTSACSSAQQPCADHARAAAILKARPSHHLFQWRLHRGVQSVPPNARLCAHQLTGCRRGAVPLAEHCGPGLKRRCSRRAAIRTELELRRRMALVLEPFAWARRRSPHTRRHGLDH